MLLLGVGIGCIAGFMLAIIGFRSLIAGTLKTKVDEYDGDVYLYAELNERANWLLAKRNHVVMCVDHSRR